MRKTSEAFKRIDAIVILLLFSFYHLHQGHLHAKKKLNDKNKTSPK